MQKTAVTFTIPRSGVNYVVLNGENGTEIENQNNHEYMKAIEKLSDPLVSLKICQNGYDKYLDLFSVEQF